MAALQSPRFAGIDVLQACLDGLHRMMEPETGIAVQRVQQALIDLGYPIPSGATGKLPPPDRGGSRRLQARSLPRTG
jgi:hypothetical protein